MWCLAKMEGLPLGWESRDADRVLFSHERVVGQSEESFNGQLGDGNTW